MRVPCPWYDSVAELLLPWPAQASQVELERHVAGCAACGALLEQLRDGVAELDRQASAFELSRATEADRDRLSELGDELQRRATDQRGQRARLDRAVAGPASSEAQPWRSWRAGSTGSPTPEADDSWPRGLVTVRSSDTAWIDTVHPGVRVRPLSVDDARRTVTMLIRMEPGSAYPPHRHAGREECYVLEGDLDVGGRAMSAGDYQVAEGDSVHEWQSTREGCLLLITSSQDDQLLPG